MISDTWFTTVCLFSWWSSLSWSWWLALILQKAAVVTVVDKSHSSTVQESLLLKMMAYIFQCAWLFSVKTYGNSSKHTTLVNVNVLQKYNIDQCNTFGE